MTNKKTTKITPWYPQWAKPGCKVIKEWKEVIRSGDAVGDADFVQYQDAKGKMQETMKWVKWRNI